MIYAKIDNFSGMAEKYFIKKARHGGSLSVSGFGCGNL